MMKAIALPDKKTTKTEVLEVPKPSPKVDEVLIKVSFSALDTAFEEVASRTLIPGSLLHSLKVDPLVLGWHYSGVVEGVLGGQCHVKAGDRVFGHLQYASSTKQGSLAEYITVPASDCAVVPEGVEMDVAAAVTTEALTALQALRDNGGLTSKGKSVLIIAAGGGVGTMAVQIAKILTGDEGTIHAVCSTKDISKVEKLGADHVLDRTEKDFTKDLEASSYDIVLDCTGKYSFLKLKYALKKGGIMVSTIPNITTMPGISALLSPVGGKRSKSLFVKSNRADLDLVGKWLTSGELHSVPIDGTFNAKDINAARERQADAKKSGRVVVKIEGGW